MTLRTLEALTREAAALAQAAPTPAAEVARVMQVCNACRYCEGFCAVFPAMTRRIAFPEADAQFLANLCHGCGACLHACQYAPPHDFGINVPRAMARQRTASWQAHAWPAAFGQAWRRQGLLLALVITLALAAFLALGAVAQGGVHGLWRAHPGGDFYRVFPHGLMVSLFAPVFGFAALALGVAGWRFWRGTPVAAAPGAAGGASAALAEAAQAALTLRYLDGGHGDGCHEADDRHTHARRHAHHAVFYGFMLCFAATSVATVYHYAFGWVAPYGWTSLPKLLGTGGGLLLSAGCVALWRLQRTRHPLHRTPEQAPMDRGFVALLGGVAASGLLLAVARSTPAMPLLLSLHLGAVMALFLTLPYGKFAHAVYRSLALLKWALEKRRPAPQQLPGD